MSPEITRDGKTRHASLPVDSGRAIDVRCIGRPVRGATSLVLMTSFLPA